MNRAKLIHRLKKQEVKELAEFKELLETANTKDFYKKIPHEDKKMYRSMQYVQIVSHIMRNYCTTEEIDSWEELSTEYHKAKLKKIVVNANDNEKKGILDAYGSDGSFIWEEFISEYDTYYEGLTMSQNEMDEMFGKGENKAPFLKVIDGVFNKAEKDGTLDQPGTTFHDIEKLYMDASDKAIAENEITVDKFFGGETR